MITKEKLIKRFLTLPKDFTFEIKPKRAYSGSLNIRISPDAHSQLAALAQKKGTSINNLIRNTISEFTRDM